MIPMLPMFVTSGSVQTIRPDADVEITNWTGLSAGTLFSEIDEVFTDSETSYVESDAQNVFPGTQAYNFTVGLSNPSSTPGSSDSHKITVYARRVDEIGSGHQCDLLVELLETSTVRASRNFADIAPTYIGRIFTLTAAEIATIGVYNNLRLRITATLSLSLDFESVRCRVTQAQVDFTS